MKKLILLTAAALIAAVGCTSTSTTTPTTSSGGSAATVAPATTSTNRASSGTTPGTPPGTPPGTTAGSTPGSSPGTTQGGGTVPVYGKNDLAITTAVGQQFVIELESNASTGFTWTYTQVGSALQLVDQTRTSGGNRPGSPGTQRFTFKATVSGASYLDFTYARSTPGPDDTKLRYDVTIA